MVVQDWQRAIFQTEDPEPYPLQTEDRLRYARAPVHVIFVTYIANRLLLVKVKSPYNWVISPLTQPQVANQQKKSKIISTEAR